MSPLLKFPFNIRTALRFIALFVFVKVLILGQFIIVPLIYSIMIAIILYPFVNYFVRKKINILVAITITLVPAILIVAAVAILVFSQFNHFTDSFPLLIDKLHELSNQGILWFSESFNISQEKINGWITESKGELISGSKDAIGHTLTIMGNILIGVFLIPVFVFMILYYQPLLIEFIGKLFAKDNQKGVGEVMLETKAIIHSYLVGLLIETVIIAAMLAGGIFLIGIQYALLLGILGALLNIVPYIGGIVATVLTGIVALVTESSPTAAFLVVGWFLVVQFIDKHYIMPIIVASKVKINALVSILVVIIGGAIWGASGMFLAIPLTGILKLIFDRIETMKPWGFLLGDTIPATLKFSLSRKRKVPIIKTS